MREKVFYQCDGFKCDNCSYPECAHTTDIMHAKNFGADFKGDFWEKEEKETRERQTIVKLMFEMLQDDGEFYQLEYNRKFDGSGMHSETPKRICNEPLQMNVITVDTDDVRRCIGMELVKVRKKKWRRGE